jgi:hypothetical protein
MKPMSDPVLEKYYQDLLTKPNGEYFVDMFKTVERMLREVDGVGDIRLVNMAMKELRYGLKVFSKYQDIPKVSIFGSARTAPTAPRIPLGQRIWATDGRKKLHDYHRRGWRHYASGYGRRRTRKKYWPQHSPTL